MKYFTQSKRFQVLMPLFALMLLVTSCNKELEQFPDPAVTPPTGETLDKVLESTASDSLYYRLVVRGGQLGLINSNANLYTMFVPDNMGMKVFINAASGGLVPLNAPDAVFSGFISNNLSVDQAAAIVQYNTIPQIIKSSSIPNTFPNFY